MMVDFDNLNPLHSEDTEGIVIPEKAPKSLSTRKTGPRIREQQIPGITNLFTFLTVSLLEITVRTHYKIVDAL